MIVANVFEIVRIANMPFSNFIRILLLAALPPLGIPLIRSPDPGTAVLAATRPAALGWLAT
jgi:hypothetical protein